MVPILEEVSIRLIDEIQVVKIDTEKYPSIATKYNIEALPTFIIFKDGKPCDRFVSWVYIFFYLNCVFFESTGYLFLTLYNVQKFIFWVYNAQKPYLLLLRRPELRDI